LTRNHCVLAQFELDRVTLLPPQFITDAIDRAGMPDNSGRSNGHAAH
jgi:hypothetical protein